VVDAVNLPHHHVHDYAHHPAPALVLARVNGPRARRKYADVAVWTNSMAGSQTVNTDTVEGVADYEIEKTACSLEHVDDHDDDRFGPSCL